jgi:NhaP-type Na+/H+ or K+/H+ antiporter
MLFAARRQIPWSKSCNARPNAFWEYIAFVANSLVYLLIGVSLTQENLVNGWLPVLIAIGAVICGRALSVWRRRALWRWSAWRCRTHGHLTFDRRAFPGEDEKASPRKRYYKLFAPPETATWPKWGLW